MEEVKTFNFDTGNNSLLAAILPSLQQRGIDTGMLMGMLNNNRGGGGFFGNNGGFQDIIALIVIAAIFGNGNGGGIFGGGNNQNSTERQMLLSAIERDGVVMRRWYASMVGSGEPVEWEDLLEDE